MSSARTERFALLAIKESKDGRNTYFVGRGGERATGFYMKPRDIKWHVDNRVEEVTVEVVTTDHGDFVSSTARVEGPHEQLTPLLKSLGFEPMPTPI